MVPLAAGLLPTVLLLSDADLCFPSSDSTPIFVVASFSLSIKFPWDQLSGLVPNYELFSLENSLAINVVQAPLELLELSVDSLPGLFWILASVPSLRFWVMSSLPQLHNFIVFQPLGLHFTKLPQEIGFNSLSVIEAEIILQILRCQESSKELFIFKSQVVFQLLLFFCLFFQFLEIQILLDGLFTCNIWRGLGCDFSKAEIGLITRELLDAIDILRVQVGTLNVGALSAWWLAFFYYCVVHLVPHYYFFVFLWIYWAKQLFGCFSILADVASFLTFRILTRRPYFLVLLIVVEHRPPYNLLILPVRSIINLACSHYFQLFNL